MGGVRRAELDFVALLGRRLRVIGSTLRSRPAAEKAAIVSAFTRRFSDAMNAGRVRPTIDSVFPLERAAEAHHRVQSSAHFGKVVLRVRDGASG
jgi:NADPH:quinone reductase-like Zn-dependent oxidoreductase